MEDWSVFSLNEQPIARWQAGFQDSHFDITLQIEEASPIQHEAFFYCHWAGCIICRCMINCRFWAMNFRS